jgi:hypothetical protein
MSTDLVRHKREWRLLHKAIIQVINNNVFELALDTPAVWVSSKRSPDCYCQFITLYDLQLLRQEMLVALQALLAEFRDWSIELQVAAPDKAGGWEWSDMVVEISHDRIIDRLQHDLLPEHLRQLRFGTPIAEFRAEIAATVRRLMRKPV